MKKKEKEKKEKKKGATKQNFHENKVVSKMHCGPTDTLSQCGTSFSLALCDYCQIHMFA